MIAVITDTHWGARNDSIHFLEFFKKFYQESFFPTLDKLNIKTVIMVGDIFDRRKYTNHVTLHSAKEIYFDELRKRDIKTYILVGNHDSAYKNTIKVNCPDLFLREYDNIEVIQDPKEINIHERDILFLPWICQDNEEESFNIIKNSTSKIVFGHLELSGFSMYKGYTNEHGMDPKIFKKFDLVCSGHFHHRSRKGNIQYLGNPYEITWSDFDDPRGFHIFNPDTLELEFIENPFTMFTRILYDDTAMDYSKVDVVQYKNKNIKILIVNKTDFYGYDLFMDRLYKQEPIEVKVIEDFSEFEAENISDEVLNIEDTLSLLSDYVENVDTDADKDKIKGLMKELFIEAQHMEV